MYHSLDMWYHGGVNMGTENYTVIIVLTMMLSSGCLAGINDVVDDAIDETYEYIDGEYPMLLLSQRYRGDPGLQNYGKCADLLNDLRNAAYDEMLVSLDQQAYWHWSNGPVWRFTDDVAFADGAVPESTDAPTSGSVDSGEKKPRGGLLRNK